MAPVGKEEAERDEVKALGRMQEWTSRVVNTLEGLREKGTLLTEVVANSLGNSLENSINDYELTITKLMAMAES